jgi:hypothetical protein
LGGLAEAGAQAALGALMGMEQIAPFEVIAHKVLPQIAKF